MDKYKRLVSNTLLFAISTFSSKALSFFLTSYHTRVLDTASYGTMNAVTAIAVFLIPIVSLGIANAVIRFGLEKGVSKAQVYTNGILSVGAGFVILLALVPLLKQVSFIENTVGEYWVLLLVYVLVSCLRTLNCQIVRAKELIRLYAIDGILCTATNLLFNILFLSVFQTGAQGMLLSIICSDGLSTLFLFCISKLWKLVDFKHLNMPLFRKMLAYAVPLISASIFWSITSVSDQLFVTAMLGEDWNGIYSACYKIPTLLTIVATMFTEAWQISAFTDGTKSGREHFFSKVFGTYQSIMFMSAAGIVWLCRPLMSVFVAKSYYGGWVFIPILTIATVFASLNNFLNSIYMVEKRSGLSLITMALGAIVNLVLNAVLIPIWGVNGAAIATLASYLVVFIVRVFNTRALIRIDFSSLRMLINLAILVLESMILIFELPLWTLWCTLLTALMIVLNFAGLLETAGKLLHRRG
ncbi:MAG: polysaccharide biosynthesis C-terminal domain-containing protein [Ruthenibacterium sp.]